MIRSAIWRVSAPSASLWAAAYASQEADATGCSTCDSSTASARPSGPATIQRARKATARPGTPSKLRTSTITRCGYPG
jgi:hypothetical protein